MAELDYEAALGYARWFKDESKNHDLIGLAKMGDDICELVGFAESVDGEGMGCDSEYITMEIAKRLIKEGMATPLISYKPEDNIDDPTVLARLEKEQFGD